MIQQVSRDDLAVRRVRVTHLTGDFPDPFDSFKTPVIRRLVDLTSNSFKHDVISINRRAPAARSVLGDVLTGGGRPRLRTAERPFAYGTALAYQAPGKGVFHASILRRLGDQLADMVTARGGTDVLVGHKLSIEGIAVRRAAKKLGIPYAICLQGDTDTKILAARPDLRSEFRKIYHGAAIVFPFAPWTLQVCERALGPRSGPIELLPCPVELHETLAPRPRGDELISVFHLKNHRRKNLRGLALAMRQLEDSGKAQRLSIIGGGEAEDLARCEELTRSLSSAVYEGALRAGELQQRMNRAIGLVLPSRRESFGLVFIEALFAGLPIIYPRGAAVDGYFDHCSFAVAVDAKDPAAIATAIERLVRNEAQLKRDLLAWQSSPDARRFTPASIAQVFTDGLHSCVASC